MACAEEQRIAAEYNVQDLQFLAVPPRCTSLRDICFMISCSVCQECSKAPTLLTASV